MDRPIRIVFKPVWPGPRATHLMALGTRLSALFFGQTHRNIHTRISEHRGVSALTGNHLATSIAILAHKNLQKHPVAESDFKAYKFPKLTLSLMLILDLLLSSYSNDNINFQSLTNYVTLTGHFLRIRQWGGGASTKRDHTIPSVEK